MIQKRHSKYHNSPTVTPRELLEFGLDPAVLWNVDREKKIDKNIIIVSALINGYSSEVIHKLAIFFGADTITKALIKYRNRVSDKLFATVETQLRNTKQAA